jgi:large subunit ribosomal protein L21
MYAVIHTGGKQYRVEQGERLEVERLTGDEGTEVSLTPVLLVDGDTVLANRSQLSEATVTAKIVGATRGPKINGFIYKNKSNQRKRFGHRQNLSVIEITKLAPGTTAKPKKAATPKAAPAAEADTGTDDGDA